MVINPITPISQLRILAGVPLDNTYVDTLRFTSLAAQAAYFTGKAKYTFENFTPFRLQNVMRVPVVADNVYDCNYLMFRNANFGQKWFYAFIKEIRWINVNMCEIEIELDVWQTWFFQINWRTCYVEREMPPTDNVGDNLVAEAIDYGYYVSGIREETPHFDSYVAVIATAYDTDSGGLGGYVGGLFQGIKYIAGRVDSGSDVDKLTSYLQSVVEANKVDAIASIFMMPTAFYTDGAAPEVQVFAATMVQDRIGTYTPRCKKVMTYPYNFLYVYTPDGESGIYKYELFRKTTTRQAGFSMRCGMGCNPEIVLTPMEYDNQSSNYEESLVMSGFPQCAFSVDTFKAWLAQNASATLLNTTMSAAGLIGGAATGNPIAVASGAFGLANSINGLVMQQAKPNTVKGQQGSSTNTATREKNFYFVNKHITQEYAKIVDDFFWRYGYAINQVKLPEISSRPYWNYVKLKDANLLGSIPFDDMAVLKSTLNNGITFWHDPNQVGNYTLNNRPAGG